MLPSPRGGLSGSQSPSLSSVPPYDSLASGDEAVELALAAGLILDPWQAHGVRMGLAERGGKFAAFEVGAIVSRQNGKGGIIEARELAGLFLFGETILHSTHHFRTTRDAFDRLVAIIESCPDLDRQVKRITTANGNEGIEVKGGGKLAYIARARGSGRGLSPDVNILDEVFDYPETAHTAMLPTMAARRNPQVWYTSSPPDEDEHPNSIVISRVRQRAVAGNDPSLCWLEWAGGSREDVEALLALTGAAGRAAREKYLGDRSRWADANPALGYRLTESYIEQELRSLGPRGFAVERLGIGFWPNPEEAEGEDAIDADVWAARRDASSRVLFPVALGVAVSSGGRRAALVACGWRSDGRMHGEVVQTGAGTGWVLDVILQVLAKVNPAALVIDSRGPAGSLVPDLTAAGLEPLITNTSQRAQADQGLVDDLVLDGIRIVPDCDPLDGAASAATWRDIGDGHAFDRRSPSNDISALEALSLARFGLLTAGPSRPNLLALPTAIPAEDSRSLGGLDLLSTGF